MTQQKQSESGQNNQPSQGLTEKGRQFLQEFKKYVQILKEEDTEPTSEQ